MIVVADASPLIVLTKIEHIQVLPALYEQVVIPPEVFNELLSTNRPQEVRNFFTSKPAWLKTQMPKSQQSIPLLHAGETAAIHLAIELRADLLLIDEIRGRAAARKRNLEIAGTVGVLEIAANRGLLDLADAFKRVKQTDFWISHDLLDRRLQEHLKRKRS
jgi:predicted nucleic acid-binding protein